MVLCFQNEDLSKILLVTKVETNWPNISNGNRTEWSPIQFVIKQVRLRSGSLICLSWVWLQTKLNATLSYYQLIIKTTISEKRRIAKLWKKGKINIQCHSEFDNSQKGFAGCQVTSEKQVVCESKMQPCMKTAQLHRTYN